MVTFWQGVEENGYLSKKTGFMISALPLLN